LIGFIVLSKFGVTGQLKLAYRMFRLIIAALLFISKGIHLPFDPWHRYTPFPMT